MSAGSASALVVSSHRVASVSLSFAVEKGFRYPRGSRPARDSMGRNDASWTLHWWLDRHGRQPLASSSTRVPLPTRHIESAQKLVRIEHSDEIHFNPAAVSRRLGASRKNEQHHCCRRRPASSHTLMEKKVLSARSLFQHLWPLTGSKLFEQQYT